MAKGKCIICGKETDNTFKFKYGTISCCPNTCQKMLNYKMNDAHPILWLSKSDLSDREHYTVEELAKVKPEAIIDAAEDAIDSEWNNDYFGESFSSIVENAAKALERNKIQNTKPKELPLLLGQLKFPEENDEYLLERLKSS